MLRQGLTARETAERLGVTVRRVHALAKSNQLAAEYSGPLLLLDPADVDRLAQTERLAHRTLEPINAWVLLALASGDPSLAPSIEVVSSSARSRLRARLRDASLLEMVPLLRKRAEVRWLHADDGDIEAILVQPGVVVTGVSVADVYGFDIVAPGTAELYATTQTAAKLTRTYALEPSSRANIVLHVVQTGWPFAPDTARAPALVAAVDLADSPDQRTARAGREYLASYRAES